MNKVNAENSSHLKAHNRGVVLKLICSEDNLTRIDISRKTGLAKMTVTNIINEFIDMGYVCESRVYNTTTVGRNPILLDLQENSPRLLGVNISKEKFSAILCDIKLREKRTEEFSGEYAEKYGFVAALEKIIDLFRDELDNVLAIGISSTGAVDTESQKIITSFDFPDVDNLEIGKLIRARYHVPCVFNNDSKSSALAEKLFGKGKDYDNFIVVCPTNGIGSGIVCDDELFQGGSGYVGELGHTSIDYNGNLCHCGNRGCLDTYISIGIVENQLREATNTNLSFAEYCKMENDKRVDEIIKSMLTKLAAALVNQINMLNPKCVILGDKGAFLSDSHLAFLENEINMRKLFGNSRRVQVLRSAFLDKAALVGSACLVLNEMFNGRPLIF